MAKIEKASEDVVNLFDGIRDKTSIPHWIQFEVLSNTKQKELYKMICDLFLELPHNEFISCLMNKENLIKYEASKLKYIY